MELAFRTNRIVEVVAAIPPDYPREKLLERLPSFFRELRRSLPGERELVEKAVAALAERKGAVSALLDAYATLEPERLDRRLEIVQVLGALRRDDALEPLADIVRQPLPPHPARVRCLELTARAREEIVQSKAVHGIAYLRSERALVEVERIMRSHDSVAVRVEAIDAWMWNNEDRAEAAAHLYTLLPPEYHPYVERPRFHRGMDSSQFDARMLGWMKRWAPGGRLPPNPAIAARRAAAAAKG